MWHFIAENWRVLAFVLFIVFSIVTLVYAPIIGDLISDETVGDDFSSIGQFILAWSITGLVVVLISQSFLIAFFGGLTVAILGAALVRSANRAPEGYQDSKGFHHIIRK